MNTKTILSTLIAAATLAAGGLAMAQADPPSSTPGNNCTATGNAMRGGNMSASPSKTACAGSGATTAAATTKTEPATTASTADTSSMGNTAAAPAAKKPMRVAKADRN